MRDEYQPRERPAAGGPPHNGFYVEGVVVRDPHQTERGAFITVREGEKSYWDVACWEDGPLPQFRDLHGGDQVRIEGHLAKRKVKNTDRWEISLVAIKLGVTKPLRYEAPPQQQAPQWNPNAGQQAAYYQQAAGQTGPARGQHPDAADWGPPPSNSPPPWGQR